MGGEGLVEKYKGSIINLLSAVYPEYDWLPWKFGKTPQAFWEDVNSQKKFMEWAGKELQIKEKNDWYKIANNVKINKEKQSLNLPGFHKYWRFSSLENLSLSS